MAGRREVDAVLRGEASPTSEVAQMIAHLDDALARRPTPDPIVVWVASDAAHVGGFDGVEGRRIAEPTFLQAHFDTPDADYGDTAVVLKLRVPAGVPAAFLEHAGGDPAAPSVLLLGRGLTWTASRAVRMPERTFVFGVVEGAVTRW